MVDYGLIMNKGGAAGATGGGTSGGVGYVYASGTNYPNASAGTQSSRVCFWIWWRRKCMWSVVEGAYTVEDLMALRQLAQVGLGYIGGVPPFTHTNGTKYSPNTSNGSNSDSGKAKITFIVF